MTLQRLILLLAMCLIASACTCEPPTGQERPGSVVPPVRGENAEVSVTDQAESTGSEGSEVESGQLPSAADVGYDYDSTAPEVAAAHCQSCHLLPGVADHRKLDWPIVMGHMAYWMGMSDEELSKLADRVPENELARIAQKRDGLLAIDAIKAEPLIDAATWIEILDAYVRAAPEMLPDPASSIDYASWPGAAVKNVGVGTLSGMVISALRLDEATRRLFIGEISFSAAGLAGSVYAWSPQQLFGRSVSFDNAPTAIEPWGDDLLVTNIGDLFPSNAHHGSLWRVDGDTWDKTMVLSDIPRTPHTLTLSNGDLLVSSFGHEVGKLWVASEMGDGSFEESQKLIELPGATESIAADIDGDGVDEYLVLFGQAIDGVYVVERSEDGESWSARVAIQRSPAFGHSDMSVADIDADGDVDILLTTGDNLDIPGSPPRPYHGVRIYENDGAGTFIESYFFPMHGAYGVEAGNFDDDEELELAAVAYFLAPGSESQSFVLLDRDERGEWQPFGVASVEGGQYCRIAVGNIDDSATDEVFLGGCYRQPPAPEVPRLIEVSFE